MTRLYFSGETNTTSGQAALQAPALWLAFSEDYTGSQISALLSRLPAPELKRYQAFHHHEDRTTFLLSYLLVRTVLGRYLGVAPERLVLEVQQGGKPFVAVGRAGERHLEFNLSHCRGCAALLVNWDSPCGIDVEALMRQNLQQVIRPPFFSNGERDLILHGGPPELEERRFLQYWTLKEAYLKARGEGLQGLSDKLNAAFDESGRPSIRDERQPVIADEAWGCCQTWMRDRYCISAVIRHGVGQIGIHSPDLSFLPA